MARLFSVEIAWWEGIIRNKQSQKLLRISYFIIIASKYKCTNNDKYGIVTSKNNHLIALSQVNIIYINFIRGLHDNKQDDTKNALNSIIRNGVFW